MVFANIHGYSELLQGHIYKENNMLFRMADNALSDSDQQSLLQQFEQLENAGGSNSTKGDFIARIACLEQAYPITNQEV